MQVARCCVLLRDMTTALLTVPEVAARLHCHPETVKREITRKNLTASKVAGKWLVTPDELDRYIVAATNEIRSA